MYYPEEYQNTHRILQDYNEELQLRKLDSVDNSNSQDSEEDSFDELDYIFSFNLDINTAHHLDSSIDSTQS